MSLAGIPRWAIVADDDPDQRALLSAIVRRAGFEVVEAADGEQALQWCVDRGHPDVLITDLMMPRLSGFGVLEAIHARFPGVPVVIVTAAGDHEEMRVAAEGLGVAAWLPKPLDRKSFTEIVTRLVA